MAFDHLHGVVADIREHTSAGETDPQVGRETFRAVLNREPSYDEMARSTPSTSGAFPRESGRRRLTGCSRARMICCFRVLRSRGVGALRAEASGRRGGSGGSAVPG